MPRRGGRRKKSRTHAGGGSASAAASGDAAAAQHGAAAANALVENQQAKVPKSLVLRRGKTAREVGELVDDLRHLMMPYTALHFQEDAKNRKLTLRQYCQNLALPMGISHIMAFSQNQSNGRLNLRLARTPEGPTLHFHVHQFSLSKHIKALQKRPVANTAALQANPPLVVTNNFGAATATTASGSSDNVPPHVKLMRITFQNLFPAINVATVKLADCRRVVMFHLLTETVTVTTDDDNKDCNNGSSGETQTQERQIVQMRHYAVKRTPVGVNRKVRRIVERKNKLPNLHKVNDIADYVSGNAVVSDGAPSDSEFEDNLNIDDDKQEGEGGDDRSAASSSHQSSTGGSAAAVVDVMIGGGANGTGRMQKSAIKLVEVGPRLSLELFKVEKGLGGNDKNNEDVLYHAHVQKTPAEVAEIRQRQRDEAARKEERRATQEANVQRKRQAMEEKREQKRRRKEEKQAAAMQALREGRPIEQEQQEDGGDDDRSDNDGTDDDSEDSEES